jgi:Flp pilus assembly protein TadG
VRRVIIVFVALLMGLGVLFGSQALVVDLGYGMGQHGAMQNAADAGALAAGRLMAGSVSVDVNGKTVYALTDNQIYQQVESLAVANFQGTVRMNRDPQSSDYAYQLHTTWLNTSTYTEFELTHKDEASHLATWTVVSTHQLAVQYLPCPGVTGGTPNFSASSNADLVTTLGGTRLSSALANHVGVGSAPDWNWPNPICMLRVWARESHPPLLGRAVGRTADEQELANATVRIAPTTPPSVISNVWPITHYDDPQHPDPACAFELNGCATPFWDSHGLGNFKMLIDMSRYSALGGGGTREQLFAPNLSGTPRLDQNCAGLALFNLRPCYDTTWPGTNNKNTDEPVWLANGWKGQLYLPNESDPNCTDPSKVVQSCPNSRLELFGGDLGSNMATAMNSYITNHAVTDPTCNCPGATVAVFFWRYGEQNIDQTTNIGTVWNGGNSNQLQRIIIEKVRLFRFNTSTVQPSSVSGYFVGFYSNNPPQSGPPSNIANTVILVG